MMQTESDGRVLAYGDLGAPTGSLVIHFHGAPSSRFEQTVFEDAFAALDVRLVCPDRPGHGGLLTPARTPPGALAVGRRVLSPTISASNAIAVLGVSSGGPCAVACAALFPDRVASAGVVCGVTDFGWAGAWDGYPEHEAALMRIGDDEAAVAPSVSGNFAATMFPLGRGAVGGAFL